MTPTPSRYLTEIEAAAFLGLKRGTLSNMRSERRGPRYVKPGGGRIIRYRLSDLEAWAEAVRVVPEYPSNDHPRRGRPE